MTWQPKVLVGCYIQVNDPRGPVNLKEIIQGHPLYIIPSESFQQNRTLLYSSHVKDVVEVPVENSDGNVWSLDDIDIAKEKERFERKFKKAVDILNENFYDVRIRYGIIHYWY